MLQYKTNSCKGDCSKVISWAAEFKRNVDVFVIYTDQTFQEATTATLGQALDEYCAQLNISYVRWVTLVKY